MALRIKIWLKSGFPLPPIYLKEYSINYMDAQLQRKDKPMKMADEQTIKTNKTTGKSD